MAKERGFAVVSGSSTVVARIMENGTVRFGEDMAVTGAYSGTLVLNLPSGQGDNRVVQVDSSNSASLAQLSASQIALNAGMPDFGGSTSVSGALVFLSSSISSLDAGANLDVSASNGSGSITFATEVFSIVGTANQTVTSYDEGTSTLTVSLTENVTVTGSLTASGISSSAGLQVGTSAVIGGPLTVNSGVSVFNGDLQITGNLFVSGSTVTIEVENLKVQDPIVVLGSSSAGQVLDGDRGFVFAQSGSANDPAFGWDDTDQVFRLGTTANDGSTTELTITPNGALELGSLLVTSSVTIQNGLTVTGSVNLPNDSITNANLVNDSITVTAGNGLLGGGLVALGGAITLSASYGSGSNTAVEGNTTLTVSGTSGEIEVSGGLFQTVFLGDSTNVITIGLPDSVSITSNLTVGGNLIVSGNTTLGTGTEDTVTVVGNLRNPIFSVSGANAVSGFPLVPDTYITNAAQFGGYSFYLTSSAASGSNGVTPGSGSWGQANKWYFNENGEWFASFFIAV